MTREEAKEVFLNRGYVEVDGGTIYDADKWRESCTVISEWLIEQESSDDLISRQAVLDILKEKWNMFSSADDAMQESIDAIEAIPSAEKTGTWKEDIDNSRRWDKVRFYCSECGLWQTYGETDYCPNCGARMESEVRK